jgi:hypothetical protein
VKRVNRFKLGASVSAEANGQAFTVGLEGTGTWGKTGGGLEIEAKGEIPYDPHEAGSSTALSKIAGSYVPAALSGAKKIHDAWRARKKDDQAEHSGSDGARIGGSVLDAGEDLTLGLDAGGVTGDLLKKLSEANPQNAEAGQDEGINDTMRLGVGKYLGMSSGMGEHGDMSKEVSDAPTASPFGAKSALEVALLIEHDSEGETKYALKVTRSKELRAGFDLGAGFGLNAKLTRKQEIGGVAKGKHLELFSGGREGWVSNSLGGGGGQNP